MTELTITEAADYANVTRQSIWKSIREGLLKGEKRGSFWHTTTEAVDAYRENKYTRDRKIIDGERVFDIENGKLSTFQVCRILGEALKTPFSLQQVYYLIRIGKMKAHRRGGQWVIRQENVSLYLEEIQTKSDESQMGFA